MLDFMLKLDEALKIWPDSTKWNLVQIASQTNSPVPVVVEYFSESMGKSLDIYEPVTFNEVCKIQAVMREKKRPELEARRARDQQLIDEALVAFDRTMEKVRIMQAGKNWRGAYKTLSYFYGIHEHRLPQHIVTSICDNCLRLGLKAGINFQELSQWMHRGFRSLLTAPNPEAVEDCLDFLDAYGDDFLRQEHGNGESFLCNLFLTLKPAAMEFDLMPKLNEVAKGLGVTSVMDVTI